MPDITTPESNHVHCITGILGALNFSTSHEKIFRQNCIEILKAYADESNPGKIVHFEGKIAFVPDECPSFRFCGYQGANLIIYQVATKITGKDNDYIIF